MKETKIKPTFLSTLKLTKVDVYLQVKGKVHKCGCLQKIKENANGYGVSSIVILKKICLLLLIHKSFKLT